MFARAELNKLFSLLFLLPSYSNSVFQPMSSWDDRIWIYILPSKENIAAMRYDELTEKAKVFWLSSYNGLGHAKKSNRLVKSMLSELDLNNIETKTELS